MAGNYPDAPSWRMPYDRDGTQMFRTDGSYSAIQNTLTGAEILSMNDENPNAGYLLSPGGSNGLIVMFPELRDLDAVLLQIGAWSPQSIQVSTDTTTGLDGTWTSLSLTHTNTLTVPVLRTAIASTTALGIRGFRFVLAPGGGTATVTSMHLHGEIVAGQNPNRLVLWHPVANARVGPAHFDWGNSARESSDTIQFRVKNLSSTLTAQTVRVAMESLTDTTPNVVAQHKLSANGVDYLSQVSLSNLAPGAISPVVILKQDIAADAVLGLWWFRVFSEALTWA